MRARWLKPEFFTDKKIAALGPWAALVYQALWCMADDGGTAQCDPEWVYSQMFYWWGTSAALVPEIAGAVQHLVQSGRIACYTVGDETYARIINWTKHQLVHKPSKFRYPKPLLETVPHSPGTSEGDSAALLPASPHPRHPLTTRRERRAPQEARSRNGAHHPRPQPSAASVRLDPQGTPVYGETQQEAEAREAAELAAEGKAP